MQNTTIFLIFNIQNAYNIICLKMHKMYIDFL